jgi:hypothetical protein
MPMGAVYDKMIDSPIADMKNVGGRFGGSITAAQFLARYIDKGTPGRISTSPARWDRQGGRDLGQGRDRLGVRLLDALVRDSGINAGRFLPAESGGLELALPPGGQVLERAAACWWWPERRGESPAALWSAGAESFLANGIAGASMMRASLS